MALSDTEIRRRVMLGRVHLPQPEPAPPPDLPPSEVVVKGDITGAGAARNKDRRREADAAASDRELEHWKETLQRRMDLHNRMLIEPFVDYGECPDGVVSYGLSSAGYDIRVAFKFLIFSNTAGVVVNPKTLALNKSAFKEHVADGVGEEVVIPPNCFALAESVERFEMPMDCIAVVLGKSTYARCGIVLNMTPLEPEWRGVVTLEISNTTPLPAVVFAGEGIGQVIFHPIVGAVERTYQGKPRKSYQDQAGLTLPPLIGEK